MAFSTWIRNWKRSIERRWALYQSIRRKNASRRLAIHPRLEVLEDRWLLTTYLVTSIADSGTGSLRDAITQANNTSSGITEIDFNIGTQGVNSGVQTISPGSALPALTAKGVFINGYSENQWQGVTSTSTLIELNGVSAGSKSDGLDLTGTSNTVSGLFITSFFNGIEVGGDNNVLGGTTAGAGNVLSGNASDGLLIDSAATGVQVQGNYIGTDITGSTALANLKGVEVAGSNNTIGGTAAGDRNIISGNTGYNSAGVRIDPGASGVAVQGNYIGTDVTGTKPVGNFGMGLVDYGTNNLIGGTTSGAGNVISGTEYAYGEAVEIASGDLVQGNYIGTDSTGTKAIPNAGIGIYVAGAFEGNNTIGGTSAAARNIISANGSDGIRLIIGGNLIQGNFIGLDSTGNQPLGNGGNGIGLFGSTSGANTLGGTSPAAANVISGNKNDGVFIPSGSSGNLVEGNDIGTNYNGTSAVGNGNGVELAAAGSTNTIGGTTSGARNIISGNTTDGVLIDSTASGVSVQGNYIGTDVTGAIALANSIGVESAGSHNTIDRDLISGNTTAGVRIDSGASGVQVQGNDIGTDTTGVSAVANGVGVDITGPDNTIGGINGSYTLNVISGNSGDGVDIASGVSGEQVLGNYIGTDHTGTTALANGTGVEVSGSNNTIGPYSPFSLPYGDSNVISGNAGDGVLLDGAGNGNLVQGNYIGTDVTGAKAVANSIGVSVGTSAGASLNGNLISGNTGDGVLLSGFSGTVEGNFIGTNAAGSKALGNSNGIEVAGTDNTIYAQNVISGNANDGVLIDNSASGVRVQGNYIGTNSGGTAAVGNSIGVEVAGNSNTIGYTAGGYTRNVISGNTSDGVKIDSGASGNQVVGNFIGVDVSGTIGLANNFGVVANGYNNTIGGAAPAAGNVISGNSSIGVLIGGSGIQVQGNYVGTDLTGTTAVANSIGVVVNSSNNTIGGAASGARNVISGNTKDGVQIDSGVSGVLVQWSYIGTDITGAHPLPNSIGIELAGSNNTLGGLWYLAPNVISGNSGDGVKLDSGSSGNQVLGSYIGTNYIGTAAVANSVGIEDGGSSNTIGGSVLGAKNVISGNSSDGVLIDPTATNETIQSNYIGLNFDASTAIANGSNGVEIQGAGNTIGGNSGTDYFLRNFISGNSKGDGVLIDSGASGNQVQGNFIGTAVSGTVGVGNSIGVEIAGISNTIGGTANGVGNVISGNNSDGVLVDTKATGNLVQGSYVGTDYTGRGPLANGGSGIEIQGTGNTVGAGNVLSGNSADGLRLDASASGNLVLGSLIGLNLSGAGSNGGNGVNIAGNNNTIGGTVSAAFNILSGNTKDGVLIASGAGGNLVLGNYIGTNLGGAAAAANSIGVEVAGNNNTIGSTVYAARNIISSNTGDGVKIDGGASGNTVLGDYIGVNVYDNAALGNGTGIEVGGSSNTLGASWAVAPNVVSGNSGDGVKLDSGSSGNVVLGSFIGTDHTGTVAEGNSIGIEDGGSGNLIGGSVLGARNVISGNSTDGVLIDSTGTKETMQGNYIGTDYSVSTALANGTNGVEIQGAANTIGGNGSTTSLITNCIDGNNKGDGVKIDSAASGNTVVNNFIGVQISGKTGLANSIGIEIGGSNNSVGGTTNAYTNVISGNSGDGVLLDSTGAGNVIQGSFIGTDYTGTAALGNSGNGIEIAGNNNTVGGTASGAGNIISGNTKDGVLVSAGSGNTISQNSIYANTGAGISLSTGANNNIVAPTLTTATLSGSTLTVQGSFTAPTANVSYVLEFFANLSTDAEGKYYLGSLTVTPTSTATVNFTFTTTNTSQLGTYPLITATLTDNTEDTSAFSNGATTN